MNQRVPLTVVARLAGVEAPVEPFEELLGTGFVRWEPHEPGCPVEFAHPLYRQAVYDDLSPSRRRDLHRAVAEGTNAAAALAHRVAAADGADGALAEELEAKARHDLDQGNKTEAGRTFQWASSLSVDPAAAQRRLVAAALAYADGGQMGRGRPCARTSSRTNTDWAAASWWGCSSGTVATPRPPVSGSSGSSTRRTRPDRRYGP